MIPFPGMTSFAFTIPLPSWLLVSGILTILGGIMIGLRAIQKRFSPHPELVRKLLHIPMGLLTLTFPWIFTSPVPVIILAALAGIWLFMLRCYPPLQQRLGSVLGDVKRQSWGEIYFPVAVALLFALSGRDPILFCIPILMLTLADAVAAVIGVYYGRLRYSTTEGYKSAEGSVTFFMTAFFSVHIPLLLFTDTGRAETLLIAAILGLLVMLLEAIAWRGLDNLLIPLGGFLLLRTHLSMAVPGLGLRLVITVLLVLFVLCYRKQTTLNDGALLGVAFLGYLSWMIGGWSWFISPFILLVSYPLLVSWVDQQKAPLTPSEQNVMGWLPKDPNSHPRQWERIHTLSSVLSVYAGGFLWLILFALFDRPTLIYPYVLAFAANLSIIGVAGLSPINYWRSSHFLWLIVYILTGWFLFGFSALIIPSISLNSVTDGVFPLLGIALPAIGYYSLQPHLRHQPQDTLAWCCRAIFTTLGSLAGLLAL